MMEGVSSTASAAGIETKAEAGSLWPIPTLTLYFNDPDAFNARLAQIILDEERKILGGSTPTEVAGITDGLSAYWLNFNVLNWNYPEIRQFRNVVLDGIRQWVTIFGGDPADPGMQVAGISCWANVLRYGERLTVHHHDPSFLSAHLRSWHGRLCPLKRSPNDCVVVAESQRDAFRAAAGHGRPFHLAPVKPW